MSPVGVWIVSVASIAAILFRPFALPEWVWATCGAVVLFLTHGIGSGAAAHAVLRGLDVYFFLIGMMLLSEQARADGIFDWLAAEATARARRSSWRLFGLVYLSGIVVTVFLSNDATAVVMTPAVYAAVKKAGAKPMPYLFACAMIANAASFVLPISNPANLVVYHGEMPPVLEWLKIFGLPSLLSVAVTFAVLLGWFREDLKSPLPKMDLSLRARLSSDAKWTALGLLMVVVVLLTASALQRDLGLPTLVCALAIVALNSVRAFRLPAVIFKNVSWGVIPLVAGLFVIVGSLDEAGALHFARDFLLRLSHAPELTARWGASFAIAVASNLVNNLPVGLMSGIAVHDPAVSQTVRNSVLIGVDLGPNLSVTGSLATILWLIALRREGENASGWNFFQLGLVAMPLALALSTLFL